jgi:adenine phosphoribosyltransferase
MALSPDHPGRLVARVTRGLRDVPDFPSPGILFKDITPVLADGALFGAVVDGMAAPFRADAVTHVAGIESRGFILGAPIARALGAGFIPLRKPGKLPWRALRVDYALEYGVDALEMHEDALPPGSRVLVVDDVLATGGTAAAACALVEGTGADLVGISVLLCISALGGMRRLTGRRREILVTI